MRYDHCQILRYSVMEYNNIIRQKWILSRGRWQNHRIQRTTGILPVIQHRVVREQIQERFGLCAVLPEVVLSVTRFDTLSESKDSVSLTESGGREDPLRYLQARIALPSPNVERPLAKPSSKICISHTESPLRPLARRDRKRIATNHSPR